MGDRTEEFCRLYGEDRVTQIIEAMIELRRQSRESGTVDDITFTDITAHDAINHTMIGYFQHDGDEVCFNIDNGNWNGTVVNSFGEDADMTPPPITVWRLRPKEVPSWGPDGDETPAQYAKRVETWRKRNDVIFAHWKTEKWFQDLERSLNYDRRFAPGLKTDEHYRAAAEKRGLVIVAEEHAK